MEEMDRAGAEEEGGQKSLLLVRQQEVRQQPTKGDAAGKGNGDSRERNAYGRSSHPSDELEVGLHSGQQEQQEDANLGNGVEHRALLFG